MYATRAVARGCTGVVHEHTTGGRRPPSRSCGASRAPDRIGRRYRHHTVAPRCGPAPLSFSSPLRARRRSNRLISGAPSYHCSPRRLASAREPMRVATSFESNILVDVVGKYAVCNRVGNSDGARATRETPAQPHRSVRVRTRKPRSRSVPGGDPAMTPRCDDRCRRIVPRSP